MFDAYNTKQDSITMNSDMGEILSGRLCPYCMCGTELVTDKEIYGPNSTYGGKYYRCVNNHDHYVGCYDNTERAFGRVADKRLRELKHNGHEIFDPLWKNKPRVFSSRHKAYYWLSKQLGLDRNLTHFGMFDEEQCSRAISVINEYKKSLGLNVDSKCQYNGD